MNSFLKSQLSVHDHLKHAKKKKKKTVKKFPKGDLYKTRYLMVG